MNALKKYRNYIYAGLAIGVLAAALALLSGCATKPPTKLEQQIFNVTTNPPGIVLQTNIIPVTVYQTNGIPVTVYHTNVVFFTNTAESYIYSRGPGGQAIVDTGTGIGSIFGVGGIVGTGLGALLSLWGYLRSKKTLVTAANMAQVVETMREFIKTLPNGSQMDNELVNWMQLHQAEAGVLQQVVALLQSQVSNPDAQVAAQQIMQTLQALRNLTPPPNVPTV